MSLTKQDLHAIKSIVDTSIDDAITNRIEPMMDQKIEDLRLHTAAGFEGVDQRFDRLEKKVSRIDNELQGVKKTVARIDNELQVVTKTVGRIDSELQTVTKTVGRIDNELQMVKKITGRIEKQQRTDRTHGEEHDTRLTHLELHTGLSRA